MKDFNKTSLLTLGAMLAVLLPTAGCFGVGNPCKSNDNCPVPEHCVVQLGTTTATCVHPTALLPAPATCTADEQCASGECYEGYCYSESLVDACFDDDSLCSLSYCNLQGMCEPSDNGENFVRGVGDDEAIIITNQADLDALDGINVIVGKLWIGIDEEGAVSDVGVSTINLPDLTKVTQGIEVRGQQSLVSLDLPNLEWVGFDGFIVEDNEGLERVSAPQLLRVGRTLIGGPVQFDGNPDLGDIDLSTLAISYTLNMFLGPDDDTLPRLPMELRIPRLTSVEYVFSLQGGHTTFTTLQLPPLEACPWVVLSEIDTDVSNFVQGLRTVSDDLSLSYLSGNGTLALNTLRVVGELSVESTTATTLSFPALVSSTSVTISDNANLTSLSAPSLNSAESFEVSDNPLLDVCQAKSIADQTDASSVDLDGNQGDPEACP